MHGGVFKLKSLSALIDPRSAKNGEKERREKLLLLLIDARTTKPKTKNKKKRKKERKENELEKRNSMPTKNNA